MSVRATKSPAGKTVGTEVQGELQGSSGVCLSPCASHTCFLSSPCVPELTTSCTIGAQWAVGCMYSTVRFWISVQSSHLDLPSAAQQSHNMSAMKARFLFFFWSLLLKSNNVSLLFKGITPFVIFNLVKLYYINFAITKFLSFSVTIWVTITSIS